MSDIKAIAFDVCGTLVDMAVPHEELRHYVKNSRDADQWAPLDVPRSWLDLKVHPDVRDCIDNLRSEHYMCVTLSNVPVWWQAWVMRRNRVEFDHMIPLEMIRTYKPRRPCYELVGDLLGLDPQQILMVTANETFGDLKASTEIGMQAALIRSPKTYPTLTELVDELLTEGKLTKVYHA